MAGWWCNNHLTNHLEKYEFVNGKDDPIFFWKIKAMFETTKQMGLFIRCWPKKTPTAQRVPILGIPKSNAVAPRHDGPHHGQVPAWQELRCHGAILGPGGET